MYWREHPPPHIHAFYQGFEALIRIDTGEVMAGRLPPVALRIILPWIERRRLELMANWERSLRREPFEQVAGADVE